MAPRPDIIHRLIRYTHSVSIMLSLLHCYRAPLQHMHTFLLVIDFAWYLLFRVAFYPAARSVSFLFLSGRFRAFLRPYVTQSTS